LIRPFAVADTNTIVSSLLSPQSTTSFALDRLGASYHLLGSEETITELYEVFLRAKFARIPAHRREQFLMDYVQSLNIVEVRQQIRACRDPKDDKFLSLAISGDAGLILTGDTDLLTLHPFRGIDILSPSDYLAR